jgi:hypothetical protein
VAYLGASALHALWDSSNGIASLLALFLTGNAAQELRRGFLLASTANAIQALSTALYIVTIAITSVVGMLALWLALRHYRRRLLTASRPPVSMPPAPLPPL